MSERKKGSPTFRTAEQVNGGSWARYFEKLGAGVWTKQIMMNQ